MNNKKNVPDTGALLFACAPAVYYTCAINIICLILKSVFGAQAFPPIFLQLLPVLAVLPFTLWRYRSEPDYGIYHRVLVPKGGSAFRFPVYFAFVMAVVFAGVACNNLIQMTGLTQRSAGYWQANRIFFGSGLLLELVTLCVLVPLAEELIYRGFVMQRLARTYAPSVCALLSGLLFGVLHFNVVQGLYAAALGMLLAHAALRTGRLGVALAAHMALNLVALLRTETDWFAFMDGNASSFRAATVACAALAGVFLYYAETSVRGIGQR